MRGPVSLQAAPTLALVMLAAPVAADTITVPDDYPFIQTAIVASADKDVIQVRPGVYTETLDFLGRDITLESLEGPGVTIIDANGEGPVVRFVHGESSATILRGFTLTGGTGASDTFLDHGGGIYCIGASPQIIGNVITDNHVTGDGGAAYCRGGGSPLFRDNVVTGNSTIWYSGGAFYCRDVTVTFDSNVITLNDGDDSGGAFDLGDCLVTMVGNTIADNVCSDDGGALRAEGCEMAIVDNEFTGNVAGDLGGALHILGGEVVMTGNVVHDNTCNSRGGGANV
ncbi:MAG: right-handed parallel beta-helix repeat-containing protein, partial [Planctomycetota bacterium]